MRICSLRAPFARIAVLLVAIPVMGLAQGTAADYERADSYARDLPKLVYGEVQPSWVQGTHLFWYRVHTRTGDRFFLVDADKGIRGPAFDHDRLAAELAKASGKEVRGADLPFTSLEYGKDGRSFGFEAFGYRWSFTPKEDRLQKGASIEDSGPPRHGEEVKSPDGKQLAFIRDYNLFIRSTETGEELRLSDDGTEDHYYTGVTWAPSSKRIAIYQMKRGLVSTVHLIESSPKDQLMAKWSSRPYQLPGDVLDSRRLCVFFVDDRPPVKADLPPDSAPWWAGMLEAPVWATDSRDLVLRWQKRGEGTARVYLVDPSTGKVRTIVEETSATFIDRYNAMMEYASATRELIWSSERDGWRHLYLYNVVEGTLQNRITQGDWVVRGIDRVDEPSRRIYFRASGRTPGEDPYFIRGYRVDFDGTNLVELTPEPGNHALIYSPDHAYFVDTCSRVDEPPASRLKRASDGKVVMTFGSADIADLLKTGWKRPEPFVSKGRDGAADIHGVIYKPMGFDPARSYPVIEAIYAGPHSSYVPKSFRADNWGHALTELGFIVVQIDGMGTANRSKAFHDVCWKNLADAGFPDRIAWIKAAARTHPFMDLDRVGIYGFSAGGQNSTGALLFHPEFYKAAVSSCGCHDNRMDKAVWNEQWMGYPVGPHYEAQSNVTNAPRLKGKLLLLVGELDMNVPPESTFRLVDALIKAGKEFELVVLPGQGHTDGGTYGERRRRDFFVRHLLGMEPPDWNRLGGEGRPD